MSKKIYVVEDHAAYRDTLIRTLSGMPGLNVCGSSGSAEDALEKLRDAGAELVLVDLSLPIMNGFEFAAEARKRFPELNIMILSGHREQGLVERARFLGYQAYVFKGDTLQLNSALQAVLAGESYFPRFVD